MRKVLCLFFLLFFLFIGFQPQVEAARSVLAFGSFTGGGTDALDRIDEDDVEVGSLAFGVINNAVYLFVYHDFTSNAPSESVTTPPQFITPDGATGQKRWVRVPIVTGSGASEAAGEVRMFEENSNGADYIGLKGQGTLGSSYTLVFPATGPAEDSVLYWSALDGGESDAALFDFTTMRESGPTFYLGDGGSTAISTGVKYHACVNVPFDFTLQKVKMLTPETTGSITIDLWVDAFANWPPTNADSLYDTATEPTIAAAGTDNEIEDTDFDSGEADFTKGDIVCVNVDAVDTLKEVLIFLEGVRRND